MKKSEILRGAKKLIQDQRVKYTCNAIKYFTTDKVEQDRAEELVQWIQSLLGKHNTLECWLLHEHGITIYPFDTEYVNKMRRTRLAWIDAMILFWEEQGD